MAGQCTSQWGMQREGYGAFGTSSNGVIVTEPINNAQPTGQSMPAQMETGKPYTVSVTMVSNGETTWTRAQDYILMSRYPFNDMSLGPFVSTTPVLHLFKEVCSVSRLASPATTARQHVKLTAYIK